VCTLVHSSRYWGYLSKMLIFKRCYFYFSILDFWAYFIVVLYQLFQTWYCIGKNVNRIIVQSCPFQWFTCHVFVDNTRNNSNRMFAIVVVFLRMLCFYCNNITCGFISCIILPCSEAGPTLHNFKHNIAVQLMFWHLEVLNMLKPHDLPWTQHMISGIVLQYFWLNRVMRGQF
jgi:hypothetical protein